jgi:hypothetical protein
MIAVIGGRVLDSTALAAFAIGRPVYMRALVWAAVEANIVLAVPSAALGRAWGLVEQDHHDALRVLLDLPNTVIDELTPVSAREAGLLLAAAGQDDIAAAQVASSARRRGWPAVTGEPGTLRKLDTAVQIEELP